MTLAIIDLETTSLSYRCGLVELGCVLVDDQHHALPVIAEWQACCHPRAGADICEQALAINGYDPSVWEQRDAYPSEAPMLIDFATWLNGHTIASYATPLAHNASFDRPRLELACEAASVRLRLGYQWEDTLPLARTWRRLAQRPGKCGLADLAWLAGHWTEQEEALRHHHALEDCRATLAVLRWLQEQLALCAAA